MINNKQEICLYNNKAEEICSVRLNRNKIKRPIVRRINKYEKSCEYKNLNLEITDFNKFYSYMNEIGLNNIDSLCSICNNQLCYYPNYLDNNLIGIANGCIYCNI